MSATASGAHRIGGMLIDFWEDLQQPDVIWQVATLAVCFLLAKLFESWVQRRFAASAGSSRVVEIGHRGLRRLALPVAMLLLVLAARPVLANWHHVNLLNLALPLFTSLVVIRAVMFAMRQGFSSSAPWLVSFERGLALCVWGIVALHILGVLPELIALLEGVSFSLGGKQKINLWLILQGTGAVLTTLLVALWIGGMLEARLMKAEGLDANLRLVLSRVLRSLLVLLAVLIGLPLVGIDLTTLSVFGGALGVGLGFGLQKIAANYVSGFIILLDHSIRIGNLIEVAAQRGVVTRITTRYTLLRGQSGVEVIVPNEMLVGSVITNETLTDPKVRLATRVQVAYGTDLERAMGLLVEAARSQSRVLADPAPKAFIAAFADSGIDLELGFWIADPEAGSLQVKSDIHLALWKAFDAAGIVIPFPQREVRLLRE